jgi:hypothetical protein
MAKADAFCLSEFDAFRVNPERRSSMIGKILFMVSQFCVKTERIQRYIF